MDAWPRANVLHDRRSAERRVGHGHRAPIGNFPGSSPVIVVYTDVDRELQSGPDMQLNRRTFVHRVAQAAAAYTLVPPVAFSLGAPPAAGRDGRSPTIDAVLFDAFPIFDPRNVGAVAEQELPGRGAELMALWRTRQFEYQWLRAMSNDYADFSQCTEDALKYSATALRIDLTSAQRARLMQSFLELPVWPDVATSLRTLVGAGVRLGILSNFTPAMLD